MDNVSSSSQQLKMLSSILNTVYVPIESGNPKSKDLMQSMQKLGRQIDQNLEKVYGSISIKIPECPDAKPEIIAKDMQLVNTLEAAIDEWKTTIKETLEKEYKKTAEINSAIGEIEFWRNRSATLSTLHQQLSLPSVKKIIDIVREVERINLDSKQEGGFIFYLNDFETEMNRLTKDYNEAKDNVKFLSTLERQFKNINSGTLSQIEEALPSLMNGLKLVWTISRHINEERMGNILKSIQNEIADKVTRDINLQTIFDISPEDAIEKLDKAIKCMEKWFNCYKATRAEISNEENEKRWDFQQKELFGKTQYMTEICKDLKKACTDLKEFLILLGPELKQVIGDSEKIEELKGQVKSLANILKSFTFDIFDINYKNIWDEKKEKFKDAVKGMEDETIRLIDGAFKGELKSAEGGFDLLQNFKSIPTRENIENRMKQHYSSILDQFSKELEKMTTFFLKYKDSPPIARCMPPVAGSINWERSILGRVKRPMAKFIQKKDLIQGEAGKKVLNSYKSFYDVHLQPYEESKFKEWAEENTNIAIEKLKKFILKKQEDTQIYEIDFSPQLIMMIREAKYLDRLGKEPPKTILNVASQENEYIKYIEKLKQMIRDYKDVAGDLKPVEKNLLQKQISLLDKKIEPGINSLNWNSLGITKYIQNCTVALSEFKDKKKTVMTTIAMIEEKVSKIENAIIIRDYDWERTESLDLISFFNFFDSHKQKVVEELLKDYASVSDELLKNIEESVCNKDDRDYPKHRTTMKHTYYYWERRILNALIKMTIRSYASLRALLYPQQNPQGKVTRMPLFKINAEYHHELIYNPSQNELEKVIKKLKNIPLEVVKHFVRWMDGSCERCKTTKKAEDTGEEVMAFTFFKELDCHPVIANLSEEINRKDMDVPNRIEENKTFWTTHYTRKVDFWEQNKKTKLEKYIEKNPSTGFIEQKLVEAEKKIEEIRQLNPEKVCYYFNINNKEVIKAGIAKGEEWLECIRKILYEIGTKELQGIEKEIDEYNKKIDQKPSSIETFKTLLKDIETIKNVSMNMELRILDVQEKFRIMIAHGKKIDNTVKDRVFNLLNIWNSLIYAAKEKDFNMSDDKKQFADATKTEVDNFKKDISEFHKRYIEFGPGSEGISLAQGYQELIQAQEKMKKFIVIKDTLVTAEKLFNLPISTFEKLVAIEELNKKYDEIYQLYKKYTTGVQEYSSVAWGKLDISLLTKNAEEWEKLVKKMEHKYEKDPAFEKLKADIIGFSQSLPLIASLKQGSIMDRHWEKILKETGKKIDINFKQLTLTQVFELELHKFKEIVEEVVVQANQEFKNQEVINQIEKEWKFEKFDMKTIKQGQEEISILKGAENIKEKLEKHIMNLQSVGASKYVAAVLKSLKTWEKHLNTINDVIDIWFIVQRKWMYLESIFGGSQDIRQQLHEVANNFDNTHKRFKKIMEMTSKNPNVKACCTVEKRQDELKGILGELDKCQKNLSAYLEGKRKRFPRFYFISDEELLSILGNADPEAIQPSMPKLYDNCKKLKFSRGKAVIGMVSDEDEEFEFKAIQKPDGAVEEWMKKVDKEMKNTLHIISKEAVYNYAKEDRVPWITKQLGMVAIVGTQIWWTFGVEDVFRRVKEGDKHAMKKESQKQTKDLDDLINLVRTDINNLLRKKVNTLIKLDVHGRDIVDRFVRDSILDAREFGWESQLRFYWDKAWDDVQIRQCNGSFTYGYEYQGLNDRLVITPLTDRCVMTLTTALTFKLGGAPAGPAGTGKTETVKDLAKGLAIRCVVNNCGEGLDYKAMGTIFSGLAQTGFWGCFDEFNRIKLEVLSVVATQIKSIENALTYEKKTCELLGDDLDLVPTVGIFVTMNPGYAGRTELPDNLKTLFRPVTMIVPDQVLICEIMLMSEGFNGARILAKKMSVLYKLAKEQLSQQYHYDFGLRALKSVLVMAGALKREYQKTLSEDVVLMRALRDMNMPKFVFEDVPLFQGLIQDLFPGLHVERVGYDDLKEKIIAHLVNNNMKCNEEDPREKTKKDLFAEQVNKVVQLYETMLTRHSTMVVGPTCGGKTVIITTLKESLSMQTGIPTKVDVINSKSITVNELYGVLDTNTREWTDGILSKTFREQNEPLPAEKKERRWILFDSDVDADWVENMNSVMDDSKILTLASGDRIRMQKYCSLLYEVGDLQYASPATISRCGMVYVDPKNLGYWPFFDRWARSKIKISDVMYDSIKELYSKYIPPCISYILDGVIANEITAPLPLINPRTNLNLVKQFTIIMDALLPVENPPQEIEFLENYFIYALIWSMGAALTLSAREKFDEFLKKTSQRILTATSLFDNYFDIKTRQWLGWDKQVAKFEPPKGGRFSSLLVPTIDTARYSWFLNLLLTKSYPVMFIGDSGTAKSVTIQSTLKGLSEEKYCLLSINFSSRTTSLDFQKTLEENVDKRSIRTYGPTSGKTLIVFIDDLNMPKIDKYGTQQPIQLLRFLIDRKNLYQRSGDLELRNIVDTQYIGSMTPPSGGNNVVEPRFISLFNCANITFPSKESVQWIYRSILIKHMEKYTYTFDIDAVCTNITSVTLDLYHKICERLPRTPIKFHYIFNLRDLSRVYEGLCLSTPDKFPTIGHLIRLWRNECFRVFVDRLVNEADRDIVREELITTLIKDRFADTAETALKMPLLFGDFMKTFPLDEDKEDPQLYEDLTDFENVKKKLDTLIEDYSEKYNQKMDMVMFNDAIQHMTSMHRIVKFPRGNALLVGIGGSGKQSLTKLVSFTAKYIKFQINLKRNYKEPDFRDELKILYKKLPSTQIVFLFTDAHVVEEGFLELINNMLTIGIVPALFTKEEKDQIVLPLREEAAKAGYRENSEGCWSYYLNKCRDNLHIVLAMSPVGDTLRVRCRNFPGLVSSTSIDWFFAWPEEALKAVVNYELRNENLQAELKEPIARHIVDVHLSVVNKYSLEFETIYRRKNYSTPKNYLDFISTYKTLLKENREKITNQIKRLEGGLLTLKKGAEDTKVLNQELEIQNKEINEKKAAVEVLIEEIKENTRIADEQNSKAQTNKAELNIKTVEIKKEDEEAREILERAMPALKEAEEGLEKITSDDVNILKSMKGNPPKLVKFVLRLVYYFNPNGRCKDNDDWEEVVKNLLTDIDFLKSLRNFKDKKNDIKGSQVKRAENLIKTTRNEKDYEGNEEKLKEGVRTSARNAAGLYTWVVGIIKYYDVAKEVAPKQKKVERLAAELKRLEEDLEKTEAKIKELTATLKDLNEKKETSEKNLEELTAKSNIMKKRLDAATKLITGLGSEQERWKKESVELKEDIGRLMGNCLLCSSFLSYAGPFNYEIRKKMMYDDWFQDIISKNIPFSEGFIIQKLLTNDVQVSKWASEGLPGDELSVQNGILTTRASRFPLCIDPQQQAIIWIKEKEKKNDSFILSFKNPDYMKKLTNAIQFGKPVIFEAIDEEIDPLIDPILQKAYVTQAGQKMIKLGDETIEWDDKFKIYMTTMLANPKYTPEIMGKTMLINYNVTMQGLKDQLLNVVVANEKAEVEEQRKKLIIETSNNRATLKELEDLLLKELSNSTGPLVDNEPLIEVLEGAKSKASEIQKALEIAKETAQNLEISRNIYQPVAKLGAILFFSMFGLSSISEMYEFSLGSYLNVFKSALATARKDTIAQNRIRYIKERLTQLVYKYTCMGIFEIHKLMFSFKMTTMIMEGENELNKKEMDFFLKGNTSIESVPKRKPYNWLSEKGWKDMFKLITIGDIWKSFMEDVESNPDAWKKWYDLERPEISELPCGYEEKVSKFQKLLIVRCLRIDRVIDAIREFIIFQSGEQYVQPPTLNYSEIYTQSFPQTPIVFILSPGADPLADLQKLADAKGFGGKFKFLSLGQGMNQQAKARIESGVVKGHWVMLQNCHLLVSFLKELEVLIDEKMQKPNPEFRLWLTTSPSPDFPIGILQKSLKVVTEPPEGIRLNMKSTYAKVSEENLNQCPHSSFKPLIYTLAFFHAIIQDRRKFGKVGWNISYAFNESDFGISMALLNMYLKKAFDNKDENLPWASLKYLIGEAMYGGRVTDDYDRRVLVTYLDEYMGEFLFDANQPYYFSRVGYDYEIPKVETYELFIKSLNDIPLYNSPEVFGLHPNSEISYLTFNAKDLWVNMINMATSSIDASAGASKEDIASGIAKDIQEKIPEQFEIHVIRQGFAVPTPSQVVLLQELERFNNLSSKMSSSLKDLKRALIGEIGMSSDLDELLNSLYNGFLPTGWTKLAPQTLKGLSNWINHFERRFKQYDEWVKNGEPIVMWLSGLHIPESYLTALVQTTCRAKGWALDKSTLYTIVTNMKKPSEIKERLQFGCYISGLYLEGAKWDIQKNCLARQDPKELVVEMPVMRVVPIEANKLKLKGTLNTPVYVTQNRRNAMGVGLVFEANLNTEEHPNLWVLQGVCLILNID